MFVSFKVTPTTTQPTPAVPAHKAVGAKTAGLLIADLGMIERESVAAATRHWCITNLYLTTKTHAKGHSHKFVILSTIFHGIFMYNSV